MTETTEMQPLLATVERTMDVLECGRTTVYELMASGELESVKIGRSRRIPVASIHDYVARLRARPESSGLATAPTDPTAA